MIDLRQVSGLYWFSTVSKSKSGSEFGWVFSSLLRRWLDDGWSQCRWEGADPRPHVTKLYQLLCCTSSCCVSIVREENGGEWRQNGADLAAVLCLSDWLARWQFGNTEHQTQTTEQQTTTSPERERDPSYSSSSCLFHLRLFSSFPSSYLYHSLSCEWMIFLPQKPQFAGFFVIGNTILKIRINKGKNSGSNQAGRKPGEICYPDVSIVSYCILWVLCNIQKGAQWPAADWMWEAVTVQPPTLCL